MNVGLNLSNATKSDLKGATSVHTFNLADKWDLHGLKAQIDKGDVHKLKIVPADLSKLSNVVDNDIIKKTVCEELTTNVNAINTKVPSTRKLVSITIRLWKTKPWRKLWRSR